MADEDEPQRGRNRIGTLTHVHERSPSISSNQGKPATSLGRRATRGPYQKKTVNPASASENVYPDWRLPGSRDGLGAFPAGSDWAKLMLALKLKGLSIVFRMLH
jgi:hypothetical protein